MHTEQSRQIAITILSYTLIKEHYLSPSYTLKLVLTRNYIIIVFLSHIHVLLVYTLNRDRVRFPLILLMVAG